MAENRSKGWIILGLAIFLVFMSIYFYYNPRILGSPDEAVPGPIPSYLNLHTLIVAVAALLGSLVLAFILDRVRKKVDERLVPDEQLHKRKRKRK